MGRVWEVVWAVGFSFAFAFAFYCFWVRFPFPVNLPALFFLAGVFCFILGPCCCVGFQFSLRSGFCFPLWIFIYMFLFFCFMLYKSSWYVFVLFR